jgi:hypothetical protein
MIIGYEDDEEYGYEGNMTAKEREENLDKYALEKGYITYASLREDRARSLGFKNWEHCLETHGKKMRMKKREDRREQRKKGVKRKILSLREIKEEEKAERALKRRKEKNQLRREERLEVAVFCGMF